MGRYYSKSDFDKIHEYIKIDINREVSWVENGGSGGNFLLCLALLCYIEFIGGVSRNQTIPSKSGEPGKNFKAGIKLLGSSYQNLLTTGDVYSDLRCGFVHESMAKLPCRVAMLTNPGSNDVGIEFDGTTYTVRIKPLLRDLSQAADLVSKALI